MLGPEDVGQEKGGCLEDGESAPEVEKSVERLPSNAPEGPAARAEESPSHQGGLCSVCPPDLPSSQEASQGKRPPPRADDLFDSSAKIHERVQITNRSAEASCGTTRKRKQNPIAIQDVRDQERLPLDIGRDQSTQRGGRRRGVEGGVERSRGWRS